MDIDQVEKIGDIVATSSCFLGALGGVVRSFNNKSGFKDSLIRVVSGAIIAKVCSPTIYLHFSEEYHAILIFLIGYCGMEGISFVVDLLKDTFRDRINSVMDRIVDKFLGSSNKGK